MTSQEMRTLAQELLAQCQKADDYAQSMRTRRQQLQKSNTTPEIVLHGLEELEGAARRMRDVTVSFCRALLQEASEEKPQ